MSEKWMSYGIHNATGTKQKCCSSGHLRVTCAARVRVWRREESRNGGNWCVILSIEVLSARARDAQCRLMKSCASKKIRDADQRRSPNVKVVTKNTPLFREDTRPSRGVTMRPVIHYATPPAQFSDEYVASRSAEQTRRREQVSEQTT